MEDAATTRSSRRVGYPRRRALAACSNCRERKRKCDNLRPTCTSCLQIGARCDYGQQDASSFDTASLAILDRLSLLERLMRELPSTLVSSAQVSQRAPITTTEQPTLSPTHLQMSLGISTDRILQWPVFQDLLSPVRRFRFVDVDGSESYTHLDDLASQPGTSTSAAPADNVPGSFVGFSPKLSISTDTADIEPLVDRYFKRVNIKNPILTRGVVSRYCADYCEHGALFNLETCLVLLVSALGAISTEFDPSGGDVTEDFLSTPASEASQHQHHGARVASLRIAHCYYVAAEKRLGMALASASDIAVQCLCLAGIYQMCAVRPMSALRLFHAAGSSLQSLLSTSIDSAEQNVQINSSLFWTCYKSEREILAELPISAPALREPASPSLFPPPQGSTARSSDNEWAAAEEDSWYFLLSEMTLRRITDQVAEVVCAYIDGGVPPQGRIEELIPVVAEFEQQVESFRDVLAPAVKFPDVPAPARTEWQQYSRGRYYRVLELMHRPFLFTVLHPGPDARVPSPAVRALAEKALCYALRYLQHSVTAHRHHGTWLQLRNELREAALLLAASQSPAGLRMPDGWREGVSKTLKTFEYWAWEYQPCRTYMDVILALSGEGTSPRADHDAPIPRNY